MNPANPHFDASTDPKRDAEVAEAIAVLCGSIHDLIGGLTAALEIQDRQSINPILDDCLNRLEVQIEKLYDAAESIRLIGTLASYHRAVTMTHYKGHAND